MNAFDVRIHAIRRRPDRRRPFEVRWHAAGRARSRSFITRGPGGQLPCRAHPRCPQRPGLQPWDGGAGVLGHAPEPATISWLEHAAAYAAMKWPLAAACTRAGIADALATITPALITPGRGRPPPAVLRTALYGHAFNPARASADPSPSATGAGLGPGSLAAGGRPGRPGRDPARARGPGPAPGWEPGSGHDHHPQAGCLPQLPQLRGRTRNAGGQPAGPHHLAAPEAVLPGEPEGNCQPGRGAGHPGRDHQGPSRADRVLRLPVLRGTAPRRSRRTTRRFLRPATGRLGTADTH